ncbi:MAG: sigma-54-dependent Fis family transcriptional regulator [Nitrospirae bacterium GWB2_47_37]|nr:MAG: sigma-54-dependent Fis family transcriptional regulator [Nitrospirae bacterium GWA2_46_11]OGW24749.1 MAG: sigma-54-dependent Fis family transcriptional regulator [Nitrospirae bacterium GWB2_47_37]HAK88653.1 sigma-54-dependent Fis family transcriptional regulator [Nitrospiraceae bacterium]
MQRENFRIVIVDDEKSFLLLMTKILEDSGYVVKGFTDAEEALKAVDSFSPNLIITDLKMPKMDGIRFMDELKKKNEDMDFLMVTAFATVETAVEAMKKGAADYITKPLKDPDQLRIAVSKIYERQRLTAENRMLKSEMFSDIPPIEIVFPGMEGILKDISDVAPTDATVILYGETGTGKTLIAKIIHNKSGRSGPFVDINCAAIPETLLESELFGYEKGAFTGALSQKKGRFELAGDGTIFLDEVSEMSPALQAKFLKILQDRTFERLGSLNTIKTNARVIAATNKNLKSLVEEKKFREDLYYRLNVFPINIPPLRDRKEHIPDIANHIVKVISLRLGKEPKQISADEMDKLTFYTWPGNIRELENVIERSVIISKGTELILPDLETPNEMSSGHGAAADLKSIEKTAIENALIKTGGSRKNAAGMLGISLRSLQYKIKEYGIS